MAQYEVRCHTCNVTFPTGTKTCLHCGGRIRPDPSRVSVRPGRQRKAEPLAVAPLSYSNEVSDLKATPDRPVSADALEPEEEPVRRSLLRASMTVVWMILLAAGYAWRACSQQ